MEGLPLTGGYRYTWNKVSGFEAQWSRDYVDPTLAKCSSNGALVDDAAAEANCNFTATLKTKSPTWTLGIDYQIDPDVMLFAKLRRGSKAGDFNSFSVRANARQSV